MVNNEYYQKHKCDSYKKLYLAFNTTTDEEKTAVAYILANKHYLASNYEKSIFYYKYVITELEKMENKSFDIIDTLVVSYDNVVEMYEIDGIYDSLDYRMRIIDLAKIVLKGECRDDIYDLYTSIYERNMAELSSNLLENEDYESLIDVHIQAVQLYTYLNDKRDCSENLAENYYCLAQSYSFIEDYENSAAYAMEAVKYLEKIGVSDNLYNASYLGDCYKILAQGYNIKNDYDNMIIYIDKAIEYYDMLAEVKKETYSSPLAGTYLFAALLLQEYDKLDEARLYLKKAIQAYNNVNLDDPLEYESLAYAYFRFSRVLFELADEEFLAYALKTIELLENVMYMRKEVPAELKNAQCVIYEWLKEYYINHSDFENADYYDSLMENSDIDKC